MKKPAKIYFLTSILLMFIGVLFCIRSALEMNSTALSGETSMTMYRFTEANYYVGLTMFIFGFFLTVMPIIIDWYQSHYLDK
jgi:hypothetical protein